MTRREWLIVALFFMILGLGALVFGHFRETTYNYSFNLPIGERQEAEFTYGPEPLFANPDFFNKAKGEFIANKTNFVEADLSAMRLRVYKEGEAVVDVPIQAKGKEGTWWETPAGLYKVQDKQKSHFSSFEKVYMRWDVIFQGNFFIHGWPYYKNGAKVASAYSAGCIRLTDEDAKLVYDAVVVGSPVMVYEDSVNGGDGFNYVTDPPAVGAEEYLVADLNNSYVFMEKDPKAPAAMAHIAHLVDALVASEYVNFERAVPVTKSMIVPTAKPRLKVGDKPQLYSLMYPLLLENSNEAAETLAQYLGRKYFIGLLNNKAKSFGMSDTRFVDPAGSSASSTGNISTARDLFSLAQYIYNNRSFILNISAENGSTDLYGEPSFTGLENMNLLRGANSGLVGSVIGRRADGSQTLLAVYDIELKGVKRPVVFVLLGTDDAARDAGLILEYIKKNYQ